MQGRPPLMCASTGTRQPIACRHPCRRPYRHALRAPRLCRSWQPPSAGVSPRRMDSWTLSMQGARCRRWCQPRWHQTYTTLRCQQRTLLLTLLMLLLSLARSSRTPTRLAATAQLLARAAGSLAAPTMTAAAAELQEQAQAGSSAAAAAAAAGPLAAPACSGPPYTDAAALDAHVERAWAHFRALGSPRWHVAPMVDQVRCCGAARCGAVRRAWRAGEQQAAAAQRACMRTAAQQR